MGRVPTADDTIKQIREMKLSGKTNKFILERLHVCLSTVYKACSDPRFGEKITADQRTKKQSAPPPVKNQNLLSIAADMALKGYGTDYGRYRSDMMAEKKTASLRKSNAVLIL